MFSLTKIYIFVTAVLFFYTLNEQLQRSDGYFPALLAYLDDSSTVFILYNAILCVAIITFKGVVLVFFGESMEGQMLKIMDRLKLKILDIVIFSYAIQLKFSFQVFLVIVFLIFQFILHEHLNFRSEYLVHVHTTSTSLGLHYRALSLFIVLFFIDYEIVTFAGVNILSVNEQSQAMFLYYSFSIALSLSQPFLQFAVDFYQKYTFTHFKNSDQFLATAGLLINIPRLIIQVLISLWISYRFGNPFFFIICGYENLSEIKKSINSYGRIKKLSKTMLHLRKVEGEGLSEYHDLTCTVCYQDMKEAVQLPCKHIFHQQCIRQWIIKNLNHFCPKCKTEFNFENIEQQYENQKTNNQNNVNNQVQQAPFKNAFDQKENNNQYNSENQIKKDSNDQTERKYEIPADKYYSQSYDKYPLQQQLPHRKYEQQRQNITFVSNNNGANASMRQYIIDRPEQSDYPLQVYEAMKKKVIPIGSLPYGMPSIAVSHRTQSHMAKRRQYSRDMQVIIKLLNMNRNEQLMFL